MASIKDVEYINIDELIPYENNSKKHSDKQLDKIAKSIEEFGFISPCLIDEKNNIIAGHGRSQAAKMLGIKKVPCVRCEGLTEEQRKAYIIADNKLTELGGWDKDILALELSTLELSNFDIDITGFNITDIHELNLDMPSVYGDERKRTADAYNLGLTDTEQKTNNFWQMPLIKREDYIPSKMLGFNYAKTNKEKDFCIHFYLDDYQFERVWNKPEKYLEVLKEYDCILTPDFSLYLDMPMPMKIWNTYRSRQIGQYYQENGIKVIPTISWAEEDTFEFCFEGIEENSTVSISTIGVKEDTSAFEIWEKGVKAMIEKIKPKCILVYGGEIEFEHENIDVIYFENTVLKEWKKHD